MKFSVLFLFAVQLTLQRTDLSSQIDYTTQLLQSVAKCIALLDHLLIENVLFLDLIGFDDTTHLINLTVEPAGSDET